MVKKDIVVKDILSFIEEVAPSNLAFSWDKIGLQVGNKNKKVTKCLVTLDRSLGAIKKAAHLGCECIVAHHPLIWDPLKSILTDTHQGESIEMLVKYGISFIAAHTNLDTAAGGVNDALCEKLELMDIEGFGSTITEKFFKVVVYVPEKSLDTLIDGMSGAGAGEIGLYTRCGFYTSGKGTFIPGDGSDPTIGSVGKAESVDECKLEMVCAERSLQNVKSAIYKNHPYEEPAYDIYNMVNGREYPLSRYGKLKEECILEKFAEHVSEKLDTVTRTWGKPDSVIRKVAVCGGSGGFLWKDALKSGAQVLVTGEVKQDVALEASEMGFNIIEAGHYATEQPGCEVLSKKLQDSFKNIKVHLYVPEKGVQGRPF